MKKAMTLAALLLTTTLVGYTGSSIAQPAAAPAGGGGDIRSLATGYANCLKQEMAAEPKPSTTDLLSKCSEKRNQLISALGEDRAQGIISQVEAAVGL